MLFKKGGVFSKSVEDILWSKNTDALFNRMASAACSEDTSSLSLRYEEVKSELEKASYKLGLICVILSDTSHFAAVEKNVKTYLNDDVTGRLGFCIVKKALTDDCLEDWYRAKTHHELANEDGKKGSTSKYEEEMLEAWLTESPDFPDLLRYCNLTFEGLMYELKTYEQYGFLTPSQASRLGSTLIVAAGYGGDMPDEEAWELLDDMDFEQNKVCCRKMEQMLPRLKKWVDEEMRMM